MADKDKRKGRGRDDQQGQSIFDLFEPPPEPNADHFGKIPVVRDEAGEEIAAPSADDVERKAAAEAEAAGLQHWTAPATGQVPKVLGVDADDTEQRVKGPSWHGDDPSWSGPDLTEVFADEQGVASHHAAPVTRVPRNEPSLETGATPAAPPPPQPRPQTQMPAPVPERPQTPDRPQPSARRPLDPEPGHRSPLDSFPQPLSTSQPTPVVRPAADTGPVPSRFDQRPGADFDRPAAGFDTGQNVAVRFESDGAPADTGSVVPGLGQIDEPQPARDPRYQTYDDDDFGLGPTAGRDLPKAIAAGVALVVVLGVALFAGPVATLVLIAVMALLASVELFSAMRLAGLRPATLLGIVGAVALPVAAYYRGEAGFPLAVTLITVFGFLWYLVGADNERPVLNLSLTVLAVLWVGGLAAFAALMIRQNFGLEILASTIVITVASDTMAYIGGKAIGSQPFHSASPGKTWEGTLVGFSAALFAGFALGVIPVGDAFQSNFLGAILLGAVVGVLAPIGDLAESLVKRDLGIKDMGTIIPGHGGVLDRLDGLLFALPGAYYFSLIYPLFGT